MSTLILQTRYAQSLFDLAKKMNQLDEVYKDMMHVEQICRSNRLLRVILKNPTIMPLKKRAILQDIFNSKISNISLEFLKLLSAKRRDVYLMEIAERYVALYKNEKGIKIAHLTVASELSEQLKEQIVALLKKELKSEIELVIKTDRRLIGGFSLEIEGKLYDASLLKNFATLRQVFAKNIYESVF
ncbi:MAG: ATP synthase F1 subunit delta [Bacteroidales bacterium]|jgi:F-type H+-transporting ATPase subunit delta|nr:ATP synthase F1 subunit delta [Bacteroidales bacterium]